MVERELQHETIGRGELFILSHPETEDVFSGYGLTTEDGRKDRLVGLLMVDRPHPADPDLASISNRHLRRMPDYSP